MLNGKNRFSESAYKQYFSLQSAQIKETIERAEVRKKRLAEKRKTENKENISCWMNAINPDNGYNPDLYPYAVIPTNSRRITRLPKQRKTFFRDTLFFLIEETLSDLEKMKEAKDEENINTLMDSSPETISPFEVKACSLCRGGCCSIGETHAFLKKETLLCYISRHPDLNPSQILDSYMAYLPEYSFEDSCVNHTETGCTLPRNMRSAVCNDYVCNPLNKLRRLSNQTPLPKGIFFISRARNNWTKDDPDLDNSIIRSVLILDETIES